MWEARSNTGAPGFTSVLDADLPALHAQPLTPDSLVILFLFPDHYVAFDYDPAANLLTSSLSVENVAVQPPSIFGQGLASFIVANRQTIPRPSSRPKPPAGAHRGVECRAPNRARVG